MNRNEESADYWRQNGDSIDHRHNHGHHLAGLIMEAYKASLQGPSVTALVSALEEACETIHDEFCCGNGINGHHSLCERPSKELKRFREGEG